MFNQNPITNFIIVIILMTLGNYPSPSWGVYLLFDHHRVRIIIPPAVFCSRDSIWFGTLLGLGVSVPLDAIGLLLFFFNKISVCVFYPIFFGGFLCGASATGFFYNGLFHGLFSFFFMSNCSRMISIIIC